jgi:hypothetical protein
VKKGVRYRFFTSLGITLLYSRGAFPSCASQLRFPALFWEIPRVIS